MTDDLKHILAHFISGQTQTIDWDSLSSDQQKSLIALSRQEGLGPLLYWRLSNAGQLSSLPADIRDDLRAMYVRTWMQNRQMFTELEGIAAAFEQAGIPVVLLKGACFALTLYEDIGLRPMGDLDILVPKEKFSRALQVVQAQGYENLLPDAAPGLRELLNHEVFLQKQGMSFALEVHHSLVADKTYAYAVPVDWFWQHVEPFITRAQGEMRFNALQMLSPEAQLLYAASHAMLQHGGQKSPLRWFYDIDQLIRHYQVRLDWDLLIHQARAFEWGSALAAALDKTCRYFDTPLPEGIYSKTTALTDRHQDLVNLKQTRPPTHILLEYQKLKSLDWQGRFRLVLGLAFPTPAYMRWRYGLRNNWLLPAWYLFRWLGILKDAILTLASFVNKRA